MQDNRQDKSLIKRNILIYAEYKGISKYEIYQNTGISRNVLSQNNGMTEDNILKFLAYYNDISPGWLLTGNGPMLKEAHDKPLAIKCSTFGVGIPLYNNEAAAGAGTFEDMMKDDNLIGRYIIPGFGPADFMMYVKGNSMYPKYSSRDIIACKKIVDSHFVQWNKPHVIATLEQGLLVKRLRESKRDNFIQAISDNQSYPPFDIPKTEILGIAIVIGAIRIE